MRKLLTVNTLLLGLTLFHAVSFLTGFRNTSDDVMYSEIFAQGPDYILERAWRSAANQGRLGFLLLQPLNYISAYYSEYLSARVLYIGLYFLHVWMAFYLLSRFFFFQAWPVFMLVFLAIHPQAGEHLPPNAYPLQNTIPFLLLLWLHLLLQNMPHLKGVGYWTILLCLFLCYFSVEYAWLLGCGIFVVQAAEGIDTSATGLTAKLRPLWALRRLMHHFMVIIVTLISFILSKIALPSTYEGNSVPDSLDVVGAIRTMLLHIIDGTSLRRFFRIGSDFSTPDLIQVGFFAAIFLCVFWRVLVVNNDRSTGQRFAFRAIALIAAAMIVTLPLSITSKQIGWCINNATCAYLDSRTSTLFIAPLVGLAVLLILQMGSRILNRALLSFAIALPFAGLFAATTLHNITSATKMSRLDMAWRSARAFACIAPQSGIDRIRFGSLVDPDGMLPAANMIVRQERWAAYIERLAASEQCATQFWTDFAEMAEEATNRVRDPLDIMVGTTVEMGAYDSVVHLIEGWGAQENWGVLSNSDRAKLRLIPRGISQGPVVLSLNFALVFTDSVQSQRIDVFVNGELVQSSTFDALDVGNARIWLDVPLSNMLNETMVEVELEMPDAVARSEGSSNKRAIAFVRMTLGTGR